MNLSYLHGFMVLGGEQRTLGQRREEDKVVLIQIYHSYLILILISIFLDNSMFNIKFLEGTLDKFYRIVNPNNFWRNRMLGNDFLCKLVDNVKNFQVVFDTIPM